MININKTDKLIFDLEMLQIDYNPQKKESLRKEIAEKYGVPVKNVEVNFVPLTKNDKGEKISLTAEVIDSIQDPKFQQKLFKEYIDAKGIENVDFDALIEIDKRVNAFINFNAYAKYKPYKVKYLKWDNYLSYGKGNYFDFDKLHGLVLLTGQPENTSGKTTLAIDLLRFALFGKAEKSPTLDSVFNTYLEEETEVMVEAGIEIEDNEYVIRRTISRPALKKRTAKSKAKQKVEYFKVVGGDYEEIENCEAESGTQTNNIIRETVGNVEDFDLIISATAYTLGDLLRMGQTDKGKVFSRWLGLMTIEEKEQIAKELWKKESQTLTSSHYSKIGLEDEIKDMNVVIENDNKSIIDSQQKLVASSSRLEGFNAEKTDILTKKKDIKEELANIDITTIDNRVSQLLEELERCRAKMRNKKERYNQIKDVVFDEKIYGEKKTENENIVIRQAELRTLISNLKEDNTRIQKLIDQKTCPTCGQTINAVEQNKLIEVNNSKIKTLIEEGVSNKAAQEKVLEEIRLLEVSRNEENELSRLKPEMSAIKVQIDNLKLQVAEFQRQKQEIELNRENISYNNEINNKIRVVDEKINTETRVRDNIIREIEGYKNEISTYTKDIEVRKGIIEKIIAEEKIIRNWNIYQELVSKNGIVKIALKHALPIVNNEIARLIGGLCDFEVKLSINDNNKVCLDLIRDGHAMDLGIAASGWEGCISSIALRCALANLSSLPKCNFAVFDEITSGVSSDNVENIMKLFSRVLNNYDFIIHICHDTSLMDYHNQVITVTKENNISKIDFK